jgi:replicative DNA helicase
MTQNHEFALAKIILDNPEHLAKFYATGIDSSKVSSQSFLWRVLRSYEELAEQKIRPNRDNLISFIEIVDSDEREIVENEIAQVDTSGGSLENADGHITGIMKSWFEGQARLLINQTGKKINKEGAEAAITFFQNGVKALESGVSPGYKALADIIPEHEAYVKSLPSGEQDNHNLFGVPELNAIRGVDPGTGELIYFAGGAKSGKSSLFNTMAKNFIENNIPFFLGSGEMQRRKSYERAIAGVMDVSTRMAGSKYIYDKLEIKKRYEEAKRKMARRDMFVDQVSLSIPNVRQIVYYYYHKFGVKYFMFDRTELFKEVQESRDEFGELRRVTSALRTLANELEGVKVIVASQLNNEYTRRPGHRPKASDVYGGMAVASNCTQLFFVNRPLSISMDETEFRAGPWEEHQTKSHDGSYHFAEIYCSYNTNGPTGGSALVIFDPHKQLFLPYAGKTANVNNEYSLDQEFDRISTGKDSFKAVDTIIQTTQTDKKEPGVPGNDWSEDLPF